MIPALRNRLFRVHTQQPHLQKYQKRLINKLMYSPTLLSKKDLLEYDMMRTDSPYKMTSNEINHISDVLVGDGHDNRLVFVACIVSILSPKKTTIHISKKVDNVVFDLFVPKYNLTMLLDGSDGVTETGGIIDNVYIVPAQYGKTNSVTNRIKYAYDILPTIYAILQDVECLANNYTNMYHDIGLIIKRMNLIDEDVTNTNYKFV